MGSKRTRNIDVKHRFVWDCVLENKVCMGSIETEDKRADMPNKPPNAKLFEKHAGTLKNVG